MRRRALVKNWLPVVAPLLVLGSCETKAHAEGFYWGLRYNTSLPVGSVRTFVPDTRASGVQTSTHAIGLVTTCRSGSTARGIGFRISSTSAPIRSRMAPLRRPFIVTSKWPR